MKSAPNTCRAMLIVVALGSLCAFVPSAATALTCKSNLRANGPSLPTRPEAMGAAVLHWTAAAAARDGTAYSDWKFARKSPDKCNRINGTFGIKVWVCTLNAKPCKP